MHYYHAHAYMLDFEINWEEEQSKVKQNDGIVLALNAISCQIQLVLPLFLTYKLIQVHCQTPQPKPSTHTTTQRHPLMA
jgi:hypothetical protein